MARCLAYTYKYDNESTIFFWFCSSQLVINVTLSIFFFFSYPQMKKQEMLLEDFLEFVGIKHLMLVICQIGLQPNVFMAVALDLRDDERG